MIEKESRKTREDYLRVSDEYANQSKLESVEIEREISEVKQALEGGWWLPATACEKGQEYYPEGEYEQDLREYLEVLKLILRDRSLQPTDDYTL